MSFQWQNYTKFLCCICSGTNDRVNGAGHGNQVNGLVCSAEAVYSCGIDDTFRKAGLGEEGAAGDYGAVAVALGSQPKAMDYHKEKNTVVVATIKEVPLMLLLAFIGLLLICLFSLCCLSTGLITELWVITQE